MIKLKARYKKYFLTTISFFVGNVFTKLISFFLLPLYTKFIAPEIYGIYGVNITIIQLVMPVVYVTIWDAVFRFAAEVETKEGKYAVISNGLPVMLVSSFVCVAILLIINLFWSLYDPFLVCIYAIAGGFQYFYGYIARSMHDNKIFIISGCINSCINLMINWIGIVYFHCGIEILYSSYIIGTVVQIIIIEVKYLILKNFKTSCVSFQEFVKLIKFGGPLALNSIAQWLFTGLTQMMIAYKLGVYYNGLFSVAIKFALCISLVVSAFQFAWHEWAYELVKDKNSAAYYKRTINMLFGVLVLSSAILVLMIKLIYPYFIDETYWVSLPIIPHIVLFACMNAYSGFIATIYMSYKDVNILMTSTLISGGVNFLLLMILIPVMGFHGALVSLVAASVLMLLFRSIVLRKKYDVRLDIKTIFYVIPLIFCCIIFYSVDSPGIEISAVALCVVLCMFAVKSLYLKYFVGVGLTAK